MEAESQQAQSSSSQYIQTSQCQASWLIITSNIIIINSAPLHSTKRVPVLRERYDNVIVAVLKFTFVTVSNVTVLIVRTLYLHTPACSRLRVLVCQFALIVLATNVMLVKQ